MPRQGPVNEDTQLLAELMLQSEVFCSRVEAAAARQVEKADRDELRLKISQCRGAVSVLQRLYEADQLTIRNPSVRGTFRQLVMSLLWVTFRAGSLVDKKLFGKLVQIESGFTYLLIVSTAGETGNTQGA